MEVNIEACAVQRYSIILHTKQSNKERKQAIPVSPKAPSADPIFHRNPLSSLPPEATSNASVGLQARAKTSSVHGKRKRGIRTGVG
jgi:hypothetical protein